MYPAANGMSCATIMFADMPAIFVYNKLIETESQVRMGKHLTKFSHTFCCSASCSILLTFTNRFSVHIAVTRISI